MAGSTQRVSSASRAGLCYFAIVFAAGFAFGTLRVVVLAPRFGATPAVALELPVMLAVSWLACRWVVRRFSVPREFGARAVMGGVAFALLIAAEWTLGIVGFGLTAAQVFGTYGTVAGVAGLLGQIVFAAFPLIQRRRGPS